MSFKLRIKTAKTVRVQHGGDHIGDLVKLGSIDKQT
jgi:hypothetical protein